MIQQIIIYCTCKEFGANLDKSRLSVLNKYSSEQVTELEDEDL